MAQQRATVPQLVIVSQPVVATLTIDSVDAAVPTARALLAGGVTSIELTLRTEAAVDAIRAIKAQVGEMIVGAGTVVFSEQVAAVVAAGADFAVSPGCNAAVIEAAIAAGLPFAPGIATPSDIELALSFGLRVLKFYPAEPMGGISYLTAMAAPYRHLGLLFMPLGGVNAENMRAYLESPLIPTIGGSWIAKPQHIASGDWSGISARATEAVEIARAVEKDSR